MNVDFHCHILPGIDDGSRNMKESIEMVKLAQNSGTNKIIATSHYYALRGFDVGYGEVKKIYNQLQEAARRENLSIEIKCGQEIGYSKELLIDYDAGNIGTINDSDYMLIELPFFDFSLNEVLDTVYELQIKGIKPILAHPERYPFFLHKPELINLFIKEGYLFQLNIGSLAGEYGRDIKKLAEIYVKNKIYSVFGSDAHNKTERTTNMTDGIKSLHKIISGYDEKMNENACYIVDNKSVIFDGELLGRKRTLFSIIRG